MERKEYDIVVTVNDREVKARVHAETTLLEFLRATNHRDVKHGCDHGDCGACTVILNGKAVLSCITSVFKAVDGKVYTVSSLGSWDKMHPLQEAFLKDEALQCGFCTPGMLMTTKALLDRNPNPTRDEIRDEISGNLCRCTGYQKIIDAVEDASRVIAETVSGGAK